MRLGHRSVAFTLQQYAHVLPRQQTGAVERLASHVLEKPGLNAGTRSHIAEQVSVG